MDTHSSSHHPSEGEAEETQAKKDRRTKDKFLGLFLSLLHTCERKAKALQLQGRSCGNCRKKVEEGTLRSPTCPRRRRNPKGQRQPWKP